MNDIDFLKQKEVVSFIHDNSAADVNKLLLNPPKNFKDGAKLLADQILSRQKAEGKLDDWRKNQHLIFPPPISIEQASSSATSSFKKGLIAGKLLIDLTGGTGIDVLALSENFNQSIYVEQNQWLCQLFEHNIQVLDKEIGVKHQTADAFIDTFEGKATFFIDPARRNSSNSKVFKLEECTPNVVRLIPKLRDFAANLLIKLSPLLDLSSALQSIPNVKDVYVVSVKNDCKELLFLVDFSFSGEATVHAVNLETSQPTFIFKQREELNTRSMVQEGGSFLYEPNASILKAGAFKSVGKRYSLQKVAINTHLYKSSKLLTDFPGRAFEIIDREGKRRLQSYDGKINVITRNYPLTTNALKKRYKLKDGGVHYLIGYRDALDKPQLVIARRHS